MNGKTDTTILLDIYERLGTIEEQLRHSTKAADRLEEDNEKLEERLSELEQFRAKIGGILWIGGSLVSGALFLLWEGLTYLIPWLKAFLGRATE